MNTKAKLSTLLCAAIASVLLTPASSAISIATWTLDGQSGTPTSVAGSGSPNVTAADMTRGAGLTAESGSNSFNSKSWGGTDATEYLSFGFTIAPGYSVKLSSILFGTRSSNTGPGTLGLYSSIDNFGSPVQQWQQSGDANAYWSSSISALGLVSGDVEFRILEIGNTQADGVGDTADGGTFRITDYTPVGSTASPVTVTGEIFRDKVPEGGTSIVMLSLALCVIAATRKTASKR
jgi:hypothetical protein